MNQDYRIKLEDEVCDKFKLDTSDVDWLTDEQLRQMLNPEPVEEKQPIKRGRRPEVKHRYIKPKALFDRFNYDPETGNLWENTVHVTDGVSSVEQTAPKIKTHRATGYLTISHAGKQQFIHRLAWLLMTGKAADGAVYHVNGDKTDNRWSNLTDKMSREIKKHQARVRSNGRFISLGYFATREECEAAKDFYRKCLTM